MATIELTQGQVAIVDDADIPLVSTRSWQAHPRRDGKGWYAVARKGVRMHRFLLGVTDGRIVDHIDGNGLNNRRSNLRAGTQSQNCVNRRRTPGIHLRGVQPKKGKWRAGIKYRGRQISLGYFDTPEAAHAAYVAEAKRLHGEWVPQPLPAPPEETRPFVVPLPQPFSTVPPEEKA